MRRQTSGTTTRPPAYPMARTRIALPLYLGASELTNASIARATTDAFAAVIAATQATSPGVGGGAGVGAPGAAGAVGASSAGRGAAPMVATISAG